MSKATSRKRPKGISNEQWKAVCLVRKARKNGWTLEEMGSHLGVSFASISRWERGVTVPYANASARMIPLLEELTA